MPAGPAAPQPFPSYTHGFARNATESAHPELWEELIGFYGLGLGPTGFSFVDFGPQARDALHLALVVDWVPGPQGWAVFANADTWRVLNPQTFTFGNDDFTLFCTGRNVTGGGNGQVIVSKNRVSQDSPAGEALWSFQTWQAQDNFRFVHNNNENLSCVTNTKEDGVWHSYVTVREGRAGRIHLDGTLERTIGGFFNETSFNNDQRLQFAAREGDRTKGSFIGDIGPVGAWGRALPIESIELLSRDYMAPLRLAPRKVAVTVPTAAGDISPAPLPLHVTPIAPLITPGPVSISQAPLPLHVTPVAPSITLGPVAIAAPPLPLHLVPVAPTVTPGPVTVDAAPLPLHVVPVAPLIAAGGAFVSPPPTPLHVTPVAPTITPGAVTIDAAPLPLQVVPVAPTVATITPGQIAPGPLVLNVVTVATTIGAVAAGSLCGDVVVAPRLAGQVGPSERLSGRIAVAC